MKKLLSVSLLVAVLSLSAFGQAENPGPGNGGGKVAAMPVVVQFVLWVTKSIK